MNLYFHPLGDDIKINNRRFVCVPDVGDAALTTHGYSTYGRFLFTELNKISITNCYFEMRHP